MSTYTSILAGRKSHNVLSKFTILCWAAFTVILGCMWSAGHRLDNTAGGLSVFCKSPRWLLSSGKFAKH